MVLYRWGHLLLGKGEMSALLIQRTLVNNEDNAYA